MQGVGCVGEIARCAPLHSLAGCGLAVADESNRWGPSEGIVVRAGVAVGDEINRVASPHVDTLKLRVLFAVMRQPFSLQSELAGDDASAHAVAFGFRMGQGAADRDGAVAG